MEDEDLIIDDVENIVEDIVEDEPSDVVFGEEVEEEDSPDLPNKLRNLYKEEKRKRIVAEREAEEFRAKSAPAPIDVGPKPTLEEYGWEDEPYSKAMDEWSDRKIAAAIQAKEVPKADEDLATAFKQDVANYQTGITSLPYADKDDVVKSASDALGLDRLQLLVQAVKNPSLFVYGLGRNPEKLEALVAEKNLLKFAAEAARMEATMTTKARKAPATDNPIAGKSPQMSGNDKKLAKLEADAEKSGDRTELIRYKKSLQKAA